MGKDLLWCSPLYWFATDSPSPCMLAILQAKELSWTHVYHHLSLAGKVLAYLEARAAVVGNPHPSHLEHLKRMGPWLVSTKR